LVCNERLFAALFTQLAMPLPALGNPQAVHVPWLRFKPKSVIFATAPGSRGRHRFMRKALYMLGNLADEDVDWMSASGIRDTVGAGTVLVREGKLIDSLYMLAEGTLQVIISKPQPMEIARLGPGDIIGEISFVDSRPASATVSALSTCLLLRIPRAAVNAKLKNDVHFAARFYRAIAVFMAHRFRQTLGIVGQGNVPDLNENVEAADELSPDLMEEIGLAAARCDWILTRLKSK
jgi:CRP/FNR family cyclic AMP-dependent transcriptional regulator